MWAPPTGTVTAIRYEGLPLKGNVIDSGSIVGTKGAAWTDGYAIHSLNTLFIAIGGVAPLEYWNGSVALRYPILSTDSSDGSLVVDMFKVGGASGSRIKQVNTGTKAWTPETIASGAKASVDITDFPFVSAAVLAVGGYVADAGFSLPLVAGVLIGAAVTGDNTVRITIVNLSGGSVTLGAGTVRALVTWGG